MARLHTRVGRCLCPELTQFASQIPSLLRLVEPRGGLAQQGASRAASAYHACFTAVKQGNGHQLGEQVAGQGRRTAEGGRGRAGARVIIGAPPVACGASVMATGVHGRRKKTAAELWTGLSALSGRGRGRGGGEKRTIERRARWQNDARSHRHNAEGKKSQAST